ncbi:MAG TPA: peptidylprolyl isomerase [Polyangiales bacterium]|nr:peptidylprolyl isomerase [Polyangiales bacterium]
MLESILQKFRGIALAFMIFMLSAVFVLQFGGPQADGCSKRGGALYAAEVYGEKISLNEYRAAFALVGGDRYPAEMVKQYQLDSMVLHGLVERSLLAKQARELGFDISPDEVMQNVAEDGVVHTSMSVNAGPYLPPSRPYRFDFKDQKGKFNKDNLKRFIQYQLRRSVEEFANEQVDETLAQNMRDLVTSQVAVSPGEVWDAFVREKETVKLKYARFSPVFYQQQLHPSDADLKAWIEANQKDVDAEYEKEKHRYTGLEKQVHARHILIKVDEKASDEVKAEAKAKAEGLLARAKKGEDFAKLAKDSSEDTGSAKKGGDLGWNPKGRMVKPFDDAQFALAPGQLSDVVQSTFGYHVIKVEGVREGDVPVDEAKRELAEKLYKDRKSAELAQAAAQAALADLKSGKSDDTINSELAAKSSSDGAVDPLAPQLRDTQAFGRTDTPIAGPFDGSPLVRAAFEMTPDNKLPEAPMKLGDEYVVYRLEDKVVVKREDLTAKDDERLQNGLLNQKKRDVLVEYVRSLLKKAQDDKAVYVDDAVLVAGTNQENS